MQLARALGKGTLIFKEKILKEIGYYNGKIGPLDQMQIPLLDRAIYFADGCYDATMVRNGVVHNEKEHVDRFFNSARLLRIELPFTREELHAEFMRVIDEFDLDEGFLYWQASRATAPRNHVFPEGVKPNLMMMLTEHGTTPQEDEFRAITVEDKRFRYCNIKTLALLPNCLVSQQGKEAGANEIIFVRDGYVTEMAHSNVSFLIDGVFTYHPFDDKILPGISLKNMIAACKKLGIPTEARAITQVEAMNADELIASSSSTFCCRIDVVDNIKVGGRDTELFKKIQNAVYEEYRQTTE